MDNVIDIDDYREIWECGIALCYSCRNEWIAIVQFDGDLSKLECPICGVQDSRCFSESELEHKFGKAIQNKEY